MNILLSLFFVVGAGAETVDVSSKNLREMVEANNARSLAARLGMEAAGEREGWLARSFLPSVELHGGQETFKKGAHAQKTQPMYGAEAKINIFNSGIDRLESQNRNLETEKRRVQSTRVLSEELSKARSAFWQIVYLRERTKLIQAMLNLNNENLNAAKRRIKSGVATDSDRFEFEMKDVELRRERSTLEVELVTQHRILAMLLGLKPGALPNVTEPLSHDHDYEQLLKHSESEHEFLFREYEVHSEQQDLKAKSEGRAWLPKVEGFASYNQHTEREEDYAGASNRNESVFGIRATMSLSRGFDSVRNAAAYRKEAASARAVAEYQRREIDAHLVGEMAELKLMHDQVHEAEENIQRAERYYKITQSEYGRGVKNSPDVLGASEKLFDMRNKRLEIIRNFQLSKSHLMAKIGR